MKKIPILVVGSFIGLAIALLVRHFLRGQKTKKAERVVRAMRDFEFGETQESQAFFERNPKFIPMFLRLTELGNKYLSDRPGPKNQIEDICFGLGHACRQDFLEVIFLAVNGYGSGASKLTRGLYERSVALAYMVKNPDKVERFVRYAAIQEHRILEAALKVVSEGEFDAMMGPTNGASEIRKRYQEFKAEFEMSVCKECGTKRVQPSWDLDVPSMVQKVGAGYQQFFLSNYVVPNLALHATLSSATLKAEATKEDQEADHQVLCASLLMLLVLRSQESVFHLGLEKELDVCEQTIHNLRPQKN